MCGDVAPLTGIVSFADEPSLLGRAAEDGMRQSGYFALRDVVCDARDEVIYLRGRVPSYYLKQVAQSIAFRVNGVRRVVNLIEVRVPPCHARRARPSE